MGWATDWGGWVETGSGTREEASGECDDEDGCQGSGEEDFTGESEPPSSIHFYSLTPPFPQLPIDPPLSPHTLSYLSQQDSL